MPSIPPRVHTPAVAALILASLTACRRPESAAPAPAPTTSDSRSDSRSDSPIHTSGGSSNERPTLGAGEPADPPATAGSGAPVDAAAAAGSGSAAGSPLPGTPAALAEPATITVASHTLTAVRCVVDGAELTGPIGLDTVRDLERVGDTLWIADAEGDLRRYTIGLEGGCTLAADNTFGQSGVLDLERDIDALSADANGRVVASSGVFESWVFDSAAPQPVRCTATSHGFLTLAPSGEYAVGRFIGRDLTRVTFGVDGCTATPEPASVHFLSVQAIGFVGPLRVHGGMISEEAPTARPHQVVAYTASGDVAWRQGNIDDPFADDAYSAVGAIEAGSEGAVVLDPTHATLHLLSADGVHLGRVDVGTLTGVPAPAVGALEIFADGTGWLGVAAQRDGESPAWDGYVFVVTGL